MNMKNFPKRLDSKTSYLRITVPENLDLALEGLIRKVLKEQPKIDDIYSFAANYFETLLKIRDKAGAKFITDQLCPFHNDEDAYEMIKLAGTFSKPDSKRLRKKAEESSLTETENVTKSKDLDKEVSQDKKSVGKRKSKKVSNVEQNKRTKSKVIKLPDEEKKQTKLANKKLNDNNLERNAKKEENVDEKFLASDLLKKQVEKKSMETKLNDKRKDIKENTAANVDAPATFGGSATNKTIQEEQNPVVNTNAQTLVDDTNKELEKENTTSKENFVEKNEDNKSRNEEIEETTENKITSENKEITEQASEEITLDGKGEEKIKTFEAEEASNKQPENTQGENEESAKSTTETDPKIATNSKALIDEENNIVEKTSKNAENTEEAKIVADHSNLDTEKLKEQALTQGIHLEEKINKQSLQMIKETTDSTSETLNGSTEKDPKATIRSEIFEKDITTDINCNVKEQDEKNVNTSQEIPPDQIKSKEKEPKESLSEQQTPRANDQIDKKRESEFSIDVATKDKNSESTVENEKVKTSDIKSEALITEPNEEAEVNNNQELKAEEKKMTDDEAETTITNKTTETRSSKQNEVTDIRSSKEGKTMDEVLEKTEEFNNEDNTTQNEQPSEITVQMKDTLVDEPVNKQCLFKSDEKSLETMEITKDENTIQNVEENDAEALESKTNDANQTADRENNANENIVDTKPKTESTKSQIDSKSGFLKEQSNESSSTEDKSSQSEDNKPEISSPKLLSDSANEEIRSEKEKKLLNKDRLRTIEDALFGERTLDFEHSISNENLQTPDGITDTLQMQKKEISKTQEEQQNVNRIMAESQLTNEKSVTQKEENVREPEDKVSTSLNLLNANKPRKEKVNEALKSGTPDTEETQSKAETGKEPRKEESDNQKPKAENGSSQVSEGKTEEEISAEVDIYQTFKDYKTSDEQSISKPKYKIIIENKEDKSNPEDELCTVVDVQQIPKEDAIDGDKLEEKCKPEAETTQNKEDETKDEKKTVAEEKVHVITVEEADETEENKEASQPSGKKQIKTIQSHYYDRLQVPETVTKEFRVRNISSPPMSAILNAVNSLQQSYEPNNELLNKEEQIANIVDVNMNSTSLVDKIINAPSPTELTETSMQTENEKFDNLQSVEHQTNSMPTTSPLAEASKQNDVELDTQKSDSDDLLDLMTPTSGYSLNLSELSWQTINELFLDSEKRHSSLEKEENRYASPKTNDIKNESDEQETAEARQEIEEIIYKTVVSSDRDAVPIPPRDPETIKQTSENAEEKKEDKPEGELTESSSDSSNEQISVNDDTPFISVEVKTVIETQILDDDNADDDEDDQEKVSSDMKIKVETIIDCRNELELTQSESEPIEDKTETTVGTRRNDPKSSLEIQDKNRHDQPNEGSPTEQTIGGEGSSGESDSIISSAATQIKKADLVKRNLTRSLLSAQSLDLEKKNPLVKTKSLSTFRHGVTDFEVWNTIEKELEEAATKIQSKFRGYKTRKKLQRENAVQISKEESSVSAISMEEETKNGCQQSTGEFHDSIVLSEHPR